MSSLKRENMAINKHDVRPPRICVCGFAGFPLQYSSPVKEKLLVDCPVPPGALPPPTLVLDLEGTLLGTIYTRKRG